MMMMVGAADGEWEEEEEEEEEPTRRDVVDIGSSCEAAKMTHKTEQKRMM